MKLMFAISMFMIAGVFLLIAYGAQNNCAYHESLEKNASKIPATPFSENIPSSKDVACSFPLFAKYLAGGAIVLGLIGLLLPDLRKNY